MTRNPFMRVFLTVGLATTLVASIAHEENSQETRSRRLSLGNHNEQFFTLVSAADFTLMNGVVVKDTSSEGLRSVTFLDPGDYMAYRIDLPSTGLYQLQMYVSSPDGNGRLSVGDMATDETYDTIDSMPVTGSWDEWDTLTRNITLPEGTSMLKLEVIESGWDLLWLSVAQLDNSTATLIPSEVQADDSPAEPDSQPQNSSSVEPTSPPQNSPSVEPDSPPQNSSSVEPTLPPQNSSSLMPSLPPQDVCLESIGATDYISMNGTDLEESTDFVKLFAGDWAAYTITAPYDGTYMLQLNAMDTQGGGAFQVMDMETNQQYAAVESMQEAPMWKNINTVMDLSAGSHTLQVRVLNGCWNVASLCLQEVESLQDSNGGSNGCSCGGCGCGGLMQPEIHIHNHIYNDGSYNYGGATSGSNGSYPTTVYPYTGTDVGDPSNGFPNSGSPSNGLPSSGTSGSPNSGSPTNGAPNSGIPGSPNTGNPSNGLLSTGTPGNPNSGNTTNGVPNTGTPGSPNSGSPTNPSTGTPNSGPNSPPDSGTPSDPNSGPNTPGDGGDPSPPAVPDGGIPTDPNSGPDAPADAGDPEDPSPPALPSDPADPAVPANPSDASDPSLPRDPSSPAGAADPSSPALPSSPSNPSDPSLPALPSDPSAPSNSNPSSGGCDLVIPANSYRAMSGVDSEQSVENLTNVGWFDPGDWLEYVVTLPTAGRYRMSYRVSSVDGGGGFTVTSDDVNQVYGSVDSLQKSGGWQSWYTDAVDVSLPAGPQTLRINVSQGGWNLAWFCLAAMS